jgi:hypothetical protein
MVVETAVGNWRKIAITPTMSVLRVVGVIA